MCVSKLGGTPEGVYDDIEAPRGTLHGTHGRMPRAVMPLLVLVKGRWGRIAPFHACVAPLLLCLWINVMMIMTVSGAGVVMRVTRSAWAEPRMQLVRRNHATTTSTTGTTTTNNTTTSTPGGGGVWVRFFSDALASAATYNSSFVLRNNNNNNNNSSAIPAVGMTIEPLSLFWVYTGSDADGDGAASAGVNVTLLGNVSSLEPGGPTLLELWAPLPALPRLTASLTLWSYLGLSVCVGPSACELQRVVVRASGANVCDRAPWGPSREGFL